MTKIKPLWKVNEKEKQLARAKYGRDPMSGDFCKNDIDLKEKLKEAGIKLTDKEIVEAMKSNHESRFGAYYEYLTPQEKEKRKAERKKLKAEEKEPMMKPRKVAKPDASAEEVKVKSNRGRKASGVAKVELTTEDFIVRKNLIINKLVEGGVAVEVVSEDVCKTGTGYTLSFKTTKMHGGGNGIRLDVNKNEFNKYICSVGTGFNTGSVIKWVKA